MNGLHPHQGPFPFLDALSKRFLDLLLLNTIKKRGSMPYSDLQKIEHLPHIKVYRILKKMEEEGLLLKHDEKDRLELGRPRQLYYLSKEGDLTLEKLKEHMLSFFDIIRRSFPDSLYENFDARKFLDEGTFDTFCSPPPFLNEEDMSDEDRLELLREIQQHMEKRLEHVREKITQVQERIKQAPREAEESTRKR